MQVTVGIKDLNITAGDIEDNFHVIYVMHLPFFCFMKTEKKI